MFLGLGIRINGQANGWDVGRLFLNGEDGVAYDLMTPAGLFTDTGRTVNAADGDPVALMLDRSQGLALGDELVTNGDFATDLAGWTVIAPAGVTVEQVAGELHIVTDGTGGGASQNILTIGKSYYVSFDYTATSGALKLDSIISALDTTKTYEAFFVATQTGLTFFRSGGAAEGSIDNISVRELAGNHAIQATVSQRPTYVVAANGDRVLQNDEIDDAMSVTLPNMGTACTVAYVTQSEVRLEEGITLNGAYTLPQVDLLGFMAIDRALTTLEKVQLIRHLASLANGVVYGVDIDAMTLACLNAVDVFVYDTTKDSDGGAWATSYPAQMLVVGEAASAKIYDATDPDLPLHDTLDFTGYTITSVDAVEGVLSVGTTTGLAVFNLADDDTTVALDYTTATSPAIVNNAANAVAMTVLDDAPIDAATGLQVPTIAVATDGGVSVITDGGDVWDITNSLGQYTPVNFVDFWAGRLVFSMGDTDVNYTYVFDTLPSADNVITINTKNGTTQNASAFYNTNPNPAYFDLWLNGVSGSRRPIAIAKNSVALPNYGVNLLAENTVTASDGMVAYTTSTYNTGWMHGDIKGAWLSSTDATDLVGGELVTNGDFATGDNWSTETDWAIAGGKLNATGAATYGPYSTSALAINGRTYRVNFEITDYTSGGVVVRVGGTQSGTYTAVGVYSLDLVAALPNNTICQFRATSAFTGSIDNVSVYLLDEDRSVNNNGLATYGTVTKTAVADGAELMGYSGFSASNYLEQPYNSDLDFGTGDFHVMGWIKNDGAGSTAYLVDRAGLGGTGTSFYVVRNSSSGVMDITFLVGAANDRGDIAVPTGAWAHFTCLRRSGALELYVNGSLGASGVVSTDNLDSDQPLFLGIKSTLTSPSGSALALFRIGAGAPTAEQIAKIYEDELPLFQENAACTLYGSSDAVTALAHDPDTDLLHVGTSAGRSVFNGLERVTNTTTSVSTAISASGGLIGEK